MANGIEYINKVVLNSNATSVTFSSIPQTYTDLLLIISGRSDVNGQGDGWRIQYNGSNNTDNSYRLYAYNDGSTAALGSDTSNNWILTSGNGGASAWTAQSYGAAWYWIPNYTSTSRAKLALGQTMWGGPNPTTGRGFLTDLAGGYASGINGAAINSINIWYPDSGGTNMMTGSSFYLYGITKA